MSPFDTFLFDVHSLRRHVEGGRLHDDTPCLAVAVLALPEAHRLPAVDALMTWRTARDRVHLFDWCRATWPTLADAQAYAAYLSAKADTNPERGEEARLFAAFVEALPAAWARGRDGGDV